MSLFYPREPFYVFDSASDLHHVLGQLRELLFLHSPSLLLMWLQRHISHTTQYSASAYTFRLIKVKVKVKFTLQQATKDQRGSRCIALLFLQPWR